MVFGDDRYGWVLWDVFVGFGMVQKCGFDLVVVVCQIVQCVVCQMQNDGDGIGYGLVGGMCQMYGVVQCWVVDWLV